MIPKVSVLISVYNQVRNLALVLRGLENQSMKEFEVIIGDDGSTEEMQTFVKQYRGSFPLQHVWHADQGFRRSKILNEAFKQISTDYCIFMDSDCIPHHHFVRDHWKAREHNTVLCGRRVELSERMSTNLSVDDIAERRHQKVAVSTIVDILLGRAANWEENIRLPFAAAARLIHWKTPTLLGSNFSLDRSLFERVNGFNEDYVGYGMEDSDLAHRLQLAGAELKPLRHRAIQYHLYHQRNQPTENNIMLFQETLKHADRMCKNGLQKL